MRLLCAALPLLFALARPARAAGVDASLVSARTAAAPGERFDAGLRLRMRAGWHVYWRNPGDSGLAPKLAWSLPPGWRAGELEWPAPRRLETPPLTSFGYEGEVVLPVVLTVPADAKRGRVRLAAKADWLECREICVPGSAALGLDVRVADAPRADAAGAAALAAARAQVPLRDDAAVSAAMWDGTRVKLRLAGRHPLAQFFPAEPDVLENGRAPAAVSPAETELTLKPAAGTARPSRLEGVVIRPGLPPAWVSVPVLSGGTALRFVLLAFAGGLLLNLMPCVFPVLAFKALGLIGRHGQHVAHARLEALAYASGMVLSCESLAAVLLGARHAGAALGWGFQLQSPWVVSALAALFLAAGLSLAGAFKFGARLMGLGGGLSRREGLGGAFFSGVFAMAAAAPCTAPFMGAALGWAVTRPAREAFAVFGALGLGAAAPYACLSSWPALIRRLPRPGSWMVALERFLSLPLFATSAWLLWVLWRMLAIPAAAPGDLWKAWSPEAVAQARASGRTVFVDYTAAWCLSCQVNERIILSQASVAAALARPDVAAYRADWTSRDPRIDADLSDFGRDGVPLYVVYPRGGPAVLLPEVLTPGVVLDALGAPSASKGERP